MRLIYIRNHYFTPNTTIGDVKNVISVGVAVYGYITGKYRATVSTINALVIHIRKLTQSFDAVLSILIFNLGGIISVCIVYMNRDECLISNDVGGYLCMARV